MLLIFWIGDWTVTYNNRFVGTNSIQPILGHCVLFEQWESTSGVLGKSFNYHNPANDHWCQFWNSDSGICISFTGKVRDGRMFFTTETMNPADGSISLQRFECAQIADGIVRQYWETSQDGGESWQSIWDGKYVRKIEADN